LIYLLASAAVLNIIALLINVEKNQIPKWVITLSTNRATRQNAPNVHFAIFVAGYG
jgi:hypothetical protein